jgi:hypothetical protein
MPIGYVVSKSGNRTYALKPDNIIEACVSGPDPKLDAQSYAKDHTKGTDENAYVYRVTIEKVVGYRVSKEVVAFVTSD